MVTFGGCRFLFSSDSDALKDLQPAAVAMGEKLEEIPTLALFGFTPNEVPPDSYWVGEALGTGVPWRVGPGWGWGLVTPSDLAGLIGISPIWLDGSPTAKERDLLEDLLDQVDRLYLGEYDVVEGEVFVRLYLQQDGVRRIVSQRKEPLENLPALIVAVANDLTSDLPDSILATEENRTREGDMPATTEAIRLLIFSRIFHRLRWYGQSADNLKELIALEPDFTPAYQTLLDIFAYRAQLEAAAALLEEIPGWEEDAALLAHIGRVWFFKGDYEKATVYFERSLALVPENPQVLIYLSSIAKAKGNDRLRELLMIEFLKKSETGGVARMRAKQVANFRNQREVLTLQERWRGRILSPLPRGAFGTSRDWSVSLIDERLLLDEEGKRLGHPTSLVSDDSGFWLGVHYDGFGEVLHFDWDGNLIERLGDLLEPVALALRGSDLFVADRRLDRIVRWDGSDWVLFSQAVNKVSGLAFGEEGLYVIDLMRLSVLLLGEDGEERSRFPLTPFFSKLRPQPVDIAVDEQGLVWVVDTTSGTVSSYTSTGLLLNRIGERGSGPGELYEPLGLALADGWIFVADMGNYRIQGWDNEGIPRLLHAGSGPILDQFDHPFDIVVSPDRTKLAVSDTGNGRLLLFDLFPTPEPTP